MISFCTTYFQQRTTPQHRHPPHYFVPSSSIFLSVNTHAPMITYCTHIISHFRRYSITFGHFLFTNMQTRPNSNNTFSPPACGGVFSWRNYVSVLRHLSSDVYFYSPRWRNHSDLSKWGHSMLYLVRLIGKRKVKISRGLEIEKPDMLTTESLTYAVLVQIFLFVDANNNRNIGVF